MFELRDGPEETSSAGRVPAVRAGLTVAGIATLCISGLMVPDLSVAQTCASQPAGLRGNSCVRPGASCAPVTVVSAATTATCNDVLSRFHQSNCECVGPAPSFQLSASAVTPTLLVSGVPARAGTAVSTTRSAGYNADIWLSCSITEQVNDPPICEPPNHALTTARKDDVVSVLTTAKTSAGTYHVVIRASDANGLTAGNGDQTVSFTLIAGGAPITYSEVIQGISGSIGGVPFGGANNSATLVFRFAGRVNAVQPFSLDIGGGGAFTGVRNLQGESTVTITDSPPTAAKFATFDGNLLQVETSPGSWVGFGLRSSPTGTGFPGFMQYPYVLPVGNQRPLPDLVSNQDFSATQSISCGSFALGGGGCPAPFQVPIHTSAGNLVVNSNPPGGRNVSGTFCSRLGSFAVALGGAGTTGPNTVPVTVTAIDGFSGSVTLQCVATAGTCFAAPTTVQVASATPASALLTLGAGTQGLLNFTVSGQGQCNVTGSSANGALLIGPAANAGGGMTALTTFLALLVVWLAIGRWRHARRST